MYEISLELGRYEFRAKLIQDHEESKRSIPAEVYISENGLKIGDNIDYNMLTDEKIQNVVMDPISFLGRKFDHERVLTHVINCTYKLCPFNGNGIQINLRSRKEKYISEDIVAILLEQLTKPLLNLFPRDQKLLLKIQYPIKYTKDMRDAYQRAIQYAYESYRFEVIDQTIRDVIPLKHEYRAENILFLDMGYKSTRIYILRIGAKLPFRHKVVDEHEFYFGGYQFDMLLYNHFVTKMNRTVTPVEEVKIMKLCDQIKKILSHAETAVFIFEESLITIDRLEFETMIKCFVDTMFRKYDSMAKQHRVIANFERGGCTRIPCISEKLEELKQY